MSTSRPLSILLTLITAALGGCCSPPDAPPGPAQEAATPDAPLVTPAPEPFQRRYYDPEEAERLQGSNPMPQRVAESAPLAPAGAIAVEPTEAGVRAYVANHLKTVAPDVELREVSLDFDADSEYIARIPFKVGAARESYGWVVLLDKRGEGYIALETWAERGVDAQAQVLAHGRGDRAAVIVTRQGAEVSQVEVVRLATSGKLSRIATFGGRIGHRGLVRATYDGYVAGFPQFSVEREGGAKDSYRLVVQDRGFVLTTVSEN